MLSRAYETFLFRRCLNEDAVGGCMCAIVCFGNLDKGHIIIDERIVQEQMDLTSASWAL